MHRSTSDMDINITSTVSVTSAPPVRHGNTTEVLFFEEDGDVETLSIIVWCLGGVLLVSLLSLLGRIILARNKFPAHLECMEEHAYSNNVFRIQIPTQSRRPRNTGAGSHDTMGLVPGSDVAITDRPAAQIPQNGNQTQRSISMNAYLQNCQQMASENAHYLQDTNQRPTVVAVYEATPPQIVTSDAQGRVATVNGYTIRPPSYHDVVSPVSRIPSVAVVSRPPPMFSL